MPHTKTRLSKATWTLADQAVVSLGNFLLNIQLARHLPSADYGVYALLASAIFLFQHASVALLVYPLSLRVAAAGDKRETALMSATFAVVAAWNVVLAGLLAVVAMAAGRQDIAIAAAGFNLVWQLQDTMRRGLMAEFRHAEAAIGDAITYLGQAAAIAVLVHGTQLRLADALLAMTMAAALGGLLQLWQLRLPLPAFAGMRGMLAAHWQSGRWAFVSGLLLHARLQMLPWCLGLLHGPAATAAYQASLNIANLTNPVLFGLCNTISQASAQARSEHGARAAWDAARFYMLLGAPIVALFGLAVIAAPGLVLRLL